MTSPRELIPALDDAIAAVETERDAALADLAVRDATVATLDATIERLEAEVAWFRTNWEPRADVPTGGTDPIDAAKAWVVNLPSTGKVLLGSTYPTNQTNADTIAGRNLPVWHAYATAGTQMARLLADCPVGKLPLICFKPLGANGPDAFDAILAGRADASIDAAAQALKAHDSVVVLAILHEPENDDRTGAADLNFAAAFRYVVDRVRRAGVTNTLFMFNMMGFTTWFPRIDRLFPGNAHVDILGLDPYAHAFDETLSLFGSGTGVQQYHAWARANMPGKPVWWAEWGIDQPHASAAPKILTAAALDAACAAFGNFGAAVYWNQALGADPAANYRLVNLPPDVFKAFAALDRFKVTPPPKVLKGT